MELRRRPGQRAVLPGRVQTFSFDEGGRKRYTEIVRFGKDGLLHVEEVDLTTRDAYTYDIRGRRFDLWTAPPDFGDYVSITRFLSLDPFTSLPREAPWASVWASS